ncbi:hypothetical protein VN97_g11735 [Penicillium thymicola]|uniref:Uncharacterized protein n=1 Tax=Penicillium thymicola TaxID=293382 RepID=A0AAI9T7K2_PENTH|nr:hypothetical protein VN97_g11735 [Penicillium thymicola]
MFINLGSIIVEAKRRTGPPQKTTSLKRLISPWDFPGDKSKWEKFTEAQTLLEQIKAQEKHYNCLKQLRIPEDVLSYRLDKEVIIDGFRK